MFWFEKALIWHACPRTYTYAHIYRVNNLQHHMGVCATRGAYYHRKCSTRSRLFVVLIWELCLCVCEWVRVDAYVLWAAHLKRFFLVYDLSTESKHAKQKGRHRKRERERGREIKRKICDGGDERRMRKGGKRNRMQVRSRKITAWRWSRQHG